MGRQNPPLLKENNLPHREKSENKNLSVGDREISSILQVSMARDRRKNNPSASTFIHTKNYYNLIGQSSILIQRSRRVIWWHGTDIKEHITLMFVFINRQLRNFVVISGMTVICANCQWVSRKFRLCLLWLVVSCDLTEGRQTVAFRCPKWVHFFHLEKLSEVYCQNNWVRRSKVIAM